MNINHLPNNPYLLLTPGPLSTTKTVKAEMLKDWCTWDAEYNVIVQKIRQKLTALATTQVDDYTTVLMQGSGTFSVESMIGTALAKNAKLLCIANGAYGDRIVQIANVLNIKTVVQNSTELGPVDLQLIEQNLNDNHDITHVIVVHCETTTGMLNPIDKISSIVKKHKKIFMVDAMSSFGGMALDIDKLQIDYLVSSANKCIQGVPGFGFIIAKTAELRKTKGNARSLSLDLFDQWQMMENSNGKWRYTSPTHVVRAFYQALLELEEEGGIEARESRYSTNQTLLVKGMHELGFETVLPIEQQSSIITGFVSPQNTSYDFYDFYQLIKKQGFVIYPGKVTDLESFRIGNIGDVHPSDIKQLLKAVKSAITW